MLPLAIGTPVSGDARAQAAIRTTFQVPDPSSPTGTTTIEDFFNGLTAGDHEFERPCSDG